MSFKEWLDSIFETEVDPMDIDEDSYSELESIYREVMR